MKKILSIIITVCVLLSAMTASIYAINLSLTTTRITFGGDSVLVSNSALEDAIEITAEEAGYIAELFIADMIASETCCWDEDTEIVDVVTLYDETGTAATAHTVELTEGYAVISAFADSESLIPEWSDTAEPIYDSFDNDDNIIIYLGSYEYYVDSSDTVAINLDGNIINKSDLINYIEESRDINNVSASLIESCVVTPGMTALASIIEDPQTHANAAYVGPFNISETYDEWGDYVEMYVPADNLLSFWTKSCGPIAITNIIRAYENRYPSMRDIPSGDTVFQAVAYNGTLWTGMIYDTEYNYYDPAVGSYAELMHYYTLDSLRIYSIPCDVRGLFQVTYDNIKTHLMEGKLLNMYLNSHSTYGNHFVMCYSYSRYRSSTTGYYKTYLEVADGWSSYSERYIDLATVVSNTHNSYSTVKMWGI